MQQNTYSVKQELANSLTHGLGLLLILGSMPVLFHLAMRASLGLSQWLALVVYELSLLMVYTSSTLYHAVRKEKVKKGLKIWDHISIYFLIAGTTTFFVIQYIQPPVSVYFLWVQWILVIAGMVFKLFYTGKFRVLSTCLYLGLGLSSLGIIRSLWESMPADIFIGAMAGAGFYCAGVVFYLWQRLYYHHAIWHLFVLAGSLCHFLAVWVSLV
ncbi:hemolysin III family protein [Rapidithrix thailandica]|uniref:Hemolysin III family protein n=1 Tax=Rapidithrix thailandica TaxID=413964 RepID=A0AAW9S249_9BACT